MFETFWLAGPSSAIPSAIVATENRTSKRAASPPSQKPSKHVLKQVAATQQPLEVQKKSPFAPSLQVFPFQVETQMHFKVLIPDIYRSP